MRHYTNLKGTEARLRRLLTLDRFSSFRDSGLAESAPEFSFKEALS
jgi:hypothetical protein